MDTTTKFDINRKDFYKFNHSEQLNERTKSRLTLMASLGMEEVSVAQFGIKGKMSGLYIEMVWNYNEEEFNSYMDFVKSFK